MSELEYGGTYEAALQASRKLEADIIKNMIVAQIENKDLYLLLIFNMEG